MTDRIANKFYMWFFGIIATLNSITIVMAVTLYPVTNWWILFLYAMATLDFAVESFEFSRKLGD